MNDDQWKLTETKHNHNNDDQLINKNNKHEMRQKRTKKTTQKKNSKNCKVIYLEFFARSGSPGLALVLDTKIVAVVAVQMLVVLFALPPSILYAKP